MNRFLLPLSSTASVLDFFAATGSSSSALRFLDGAASVSLSDSLSSESAESESDPDPESLESAESSESSSDS